MLKYLVTAAASIALSYWLIAAPRIELAQSHLKVAHQQLAAASLLDMERVSVIEAQSTQIGLALSSELKNRELLQTLSNQSRAQTSALKDLQRNDKTITEYLQQLVPSSLGRLYQRTETTVPEDYRQHSAMPSDGVRTAK